MWRQDDGCDGSVRHVSPRIVILTKAPVPGRVKTRLAESIGTDKAARLHEEMVYETLRLAQATGLPVTVSLAGDERGDFSRRLEERGAAVEAQASGDLGNRLAHAMRAPGLSIALGTDCVVFTPEWLTALDRQSEDAFIGPSDDGGYWMIALDGSVSELREAAFTGMPWSTPALYAETCQRLESIAATFAELPQAYDIDDITDLRRLAEDPRCADSLRATIRSLL